MSAGIDIDAVLAGVTADDLADVARRNELADMLRDAGRDGEADLLAGGDGLLVVDRKVRLAANAQDFADGNETVVLRYAGHGAPGGLDVALLDDTELPFDLADIDGFIDGEGDFEAINLPRGLRDGNRNSIWAVWLRVDPAAWQREHDEYYGAGADDPGGDEEWEAWQGEPFGPEDIGVLVEEYAGHHGVEPSEVLVDRRYDGESVVGVRLSLDRDGRPQGRDETFGGW